MYDPSGKLNKFCRQMEQDCFQCETEITTFNLYDYAQDKQSVAKIGDRFTGRNDYFRLSFKSTVPKLKSGKKLAIDIDFGKTMPGFNGGFESLLFIDDMQICAVDTYHHCIILPDYLASEEVEFKFEIWTGFEGGGEPQSLEHIINKCDIGYEDISLKELCLWVQAIGEMYNLPRINEEQRLDYRRLIEQFISSYEMKVNPAIILDNIKTQVAKFTQNTQVELLMFGHAHVDLAWLWTLENGKEKTIRTLSTVIKYCSEYDQFRFIHSTPQIFEYLKLNQPEMFNQIQSLVKCGKIEVEGGMWVEADNNLPSGESLCKQLLYGKRFIKDNFGYESKVLWLPDVFGYSWTMPQLLKKANIDTFMTTKISWNKFNKMPVESFKWRGIDGSEIFTHFMTTPEPGSKHWNKTYTAQITASLLDRTWVTYEDKLINNKLPVAYGYGDGGGGPTREMIEKIDIFNKLPGVPNLKHCSLATAAEIMHQNIDQNEISTWDGELYLEYHRGTFTTQGLIKKYNKMVEVELKKLEQLAVYCNKPDIQERIIEYWKEMMVYQFHDILPGSSLYEANRDVIDKYQKLVVKIEEAKALCNDRSDGLFVYNHHHNHQQNLFARYYSNQEALKFKLGSSELGSYYDGEKHIITIANLDSLGLSEIEVCSQPKLSKIVKWGELIETESFNLRFNQNGNIDYLYNNAAGRNETSDCMNQLVIYNDYPANFDAWDFDIDYRKNCLYPRFKGESEICSNDQLMTVINHKYEFNNSEVYELITIDHQTKLITFTHNVKWFEENKFLRSLFATNIRSNKYTSGIQFGHIERGNTMNTSWDIAKYEICAHNYIDISQSNRGIGLISDYKYGYNCDGNVLGISLLRSPKYPDHLADIGEHHYSYSIYCHDGDFNQSQTQALSYKFANKLDITKGSYQIIKPNLLNAIDLDNEAIEISSIGYSYNLNSIIIRVVEIKGGEAKIAIDGAALSYREVSIDEVANSQFCKVRGELEFSPFEVKTIEVKINE